METVKIGNATVSRFIVGSNPFSGFSHQSPDMDMQMKRYFTAQRIKDTLTEAERLGVNTVIARTDYHIMRLLLEYWDEGGTIQWFAQTCPEVGSHERCVDRAQSIGAKGCHLHGGVMDNLFAQGKISEIIPLVDIIHDNGMLAGIAGHNPDVLRWAEAEKLPVDYYMCSYYNPSPRDERPDHDPGVHELFHDEDRTTMTKLIATLSKPAIHYKVLAAGRNEPGEAFSCVARNLRANDATCVGIYNEHAPDMLAKDVALFTNALAQR